jgi:hypothetical protein
MEEIDCIIWSDDAFERTRGHLLVKIPLAEWRALARWCWEGDRPARLPRLASLGTADPPAVLGAAAVRELQAEVLVRPLRPPPPEVTSALDALVPFLEHAVQVVDFYAGKPYTVTVVFQRGRTEPGRRSRSDGK